MKKLALLLSLALSFSAIADDQAPTSSYLVESIPFTLKDCKTMADMMAMQDEKNNNNKTIIIILTFLKLFIPPQY